MVGIGLNSANALYDPERKLRKYLQGGKIEQSGEWHFEYDKDGQLTEKGQLINPKQNLHLRFAVLGGGFYYSQVFV